MWNRISVIGLIVLGLANSGAACGDADDPGNNQGATNNSTTNDGTNNNGSTNTTPNNGSAGDGAIGEWPGEGTCIGGGGDQFTGTYRVVIDGQPVGPFSVWGVGVEATQFKLIGCHGVGGCGRGQCWPNIGVNINFINLALGDNPIAGERVVPMDLNVEYGDTTGEMDIAENAASGTATVTAWDFAAQQFAGTVDVTTDSGRTIQIEFDVDGTDLEMP